MNLLHHIARSYIQRRLASPSPLVCDRPRRPTGEDPSPLRWLRDRGFESGRSEQGGVRASDGDREQVVTFLKRHCAEGRLSTDELTSRVEAAYTAVNLVDLDRLSTDLPGSPFETAAVVPPRRRGSFIGPAAHGAAIGAGLLVLLALASMLAPPEAWAALLMLFVPLAMFAVVVILPFALPVVALLLLLGAGPLALGREHERHSLVFDGRRGSARLRRW